MLRSAAIFLSSTASVLNPGTSPSSNAVAQIPTSTATPFVGASTQTTLGSSLAAQVEDDVQERIMIGHGASYPGSSVFTPQQEFSLRRLPDYGVTIPESRAVREYLVNHPDMARIILVAAREARRILGSEIQLSLILYQDPEIDDRYLTLRVRSANYDDKLREALRAVQNRMAHDLNSASGWLHIGTDYRPAT
jgi:hypothetical protein